MGRSWKTVVSLGAVAMLLVGGQAIAGDYTQGQILKEVEYLKQQIASQQEHIEQLQSMVNDNMDKTIEAKVEDKMADGKGASIR